jgi:hypothetical protein
MLPINVSIRIGFHYGCVILEDNKIYGDTVYTAKRISTLAKTRQILTTAETVQEHGSSWRSLCRFVGRSTIKGKRGIFEIHEIVSDDSSPTIDGPMPEPKRSADARLYLGYGDNHAILDESNPFFTIGRAGTCNWVVLNAGVSRLHARIVYHNGKFLLIDVSRNGTIITHMNGTQVRVHQDEYVLSESGTIQPMGGGVPLESHILKFHCSPET